MDWLLVPPWAAQVCRVLWESGAEAFPVGGCVRDLLLGRVPGDWDVTTSALPERVMALFPHAVPTGIAHGTVTIVTEGGNVEVTTFRAEGGYADGRHPDSVRFGVTLDDDLARRDFTVNALALARDGAVVDLFDGVADLKRGIIRCVGEPDLRFSEDALRMLRGVRFAAQLGFTVEERTADAMARNAFRVAQVSRERIRVELEKTLLSPQPQRVGEMIGAGLLNHLWDWPGDLKLAELAAVPPTAEARWRAFCGATGFPLAALPVERSLRRAVEHPELAVIPTLALTGADLCGLGLAGAEISAAQRRLALHVLTHPEDNTRERLLALKSRFGV